MSQRFLSGLCVFKLVGSVLNPKHIFSHLVCVCLHLPTAGLLAVPQVSFACASQKPIPKRLKGKRTLLEDYWVCSNLLAAYRMNTHCSLLAWQRILVYVGWWRAQMVGVIEGKNSICHCGISQKSFGAGRGKAR